MLADGKPIRVFFPSLQISSQVALLMAFLGSSQRDHIFTRTRSSPLSPDLKEHRRVAVGRRRRIMRPRYFLFAYSQCFPCLYTRLWSLRDGNSRCRWLQAGEPTAVRRAVGSPGPHVNAAHVSTGASDTHPYLWCLFYTAALFLIQESLLS